MDKLQEKARRQRAKADLVRLRMPVYKSNSFKKYRSHVPPDEVRGTLHGTKRKAKITLAPMPWD